MKNIIFIFTAFLLFSCKKQKEKIISEKGAIDIVSNIYFNASTGLDDVKQFHVSRINYIGNDIIEFVPNIEIPEIIDSVFYIRDSIYYNAGTLFEAERFIFLENVLTAEPKSIYKKQYGAVWINFPIIDYEKRIDIADTVLYGNRAFKRFQINTPDYYSVFYIHPNDTLLPYSLNRIAENDYGGRLERIDNYDKNKDLFSTMWLIPRNNLDEEALRIFDYNNYIKQEFNKAKEKEN